MLSLDKMNEATRNKNSQIRFSVDTAIGHLNSAQNCLLPTVLKGETPWFESVIEEIEDVKELLNKTADEHHPISRRIKADTTA